MYKLQLTPSQSDYAAQPGDEVLSAQLAGGKSRRRRDFIGAVATVNVGWNNLPGPAFDYIEAFRRTAVTQGVEWFLIDLILDESPITEYTVAFVPGSYRLVGVQGLTTSVAAQLEVQPKAVDSAYDLAIIQTYELYGDEGANVYNLLAELVNVTLPALWG